MNKDKCPLCFQEYNDQRNIPYLLQCGDSICLCCINFFKESHQNSIECPICCNMVKPTKIINKIILDKMKPTNNEDKEIFIDIINFQTHEKKTLKISKNKTIKILKKEILKLYNMTYLHGSLLINHSRRKKIKPLSFYFEDASLSKARIFPGDQIFITKPNVQGGAIDNIKNEIDLDIGFDMKLIKRDELYINLIHFDKSMTNPENYKYFNKFKVDIVGGFYAIDDLDILKNYLEKIKNKDIPFIVISSGSSGKDVIPLCKNYSFVKEVIIFCLNYEYNKHYLSEYPGYVKKVLTSISSVYDYIKTFGADKYKQGIENFHFSLQEIEMNRQFQQCPVITASEYDKCYFLVHRAYSHFFGNMDNIYEYSNFDGYNYQKTINGLKK